MTDCQRETTVINGSKRTQFTWLCDSVRALLAEANVKLSRVGGSRVLDTLSSHDKRAGIGGMQLDTQLEELRNLQVTQSLYLIDRAYVRILCDAHLLFHYHLNV